MPFTLVFMNCHNLYEPRAHSTRGPRTLAAFRQKVRNLSMTANSAAPNTIPDLVALAEVGSEAAGMAIAHGMSPGTYSHLWSGVPAGGVTQTGSQPGLMVLYNNKTVLPTGREERDRPNSGGRHKWFAIEFQLPPSATDRFWLVVNHWTSNFRRSPGKADDLRLISACELGQFFAKLSGASEAAVLVGDFNCDPYARPFRGDTNTDRLFAVRERELVLRDRNQLFYVYNPMWRYLGEADAYEDTLAPRYSPRRPPGTYAIDKRNRRDWRTWDQMLVSKHMLCDGPAQFQERTLSVQIPRADASDHCAIAALFR